MKVKIVRGDCVVELSQYEDGSIDYIICDPPYGLEFIEGLQTKSRNLMNPTSEADILRKEEYGNSYKGRVSKLPDLSKFNLYGKQVEDWHTTWVGQCHRVLKEGGGLYAFNSAKTSHRLLAAFVRVGFHKPQIHSWMYGSGMPKARDLGFPEGFEGWFSQLKPAWEPVIVGVK